MKECSGTGVMIPISVAVSRKTGKVIRVDTINGTEAQVAEYVRALKRIGKVARRVMEEERRAEA